MNNKLIAVNPPETERSWEGYIINVINTLTRRVARLEEDNKAMQNELIKLTMPDIIDSINETPSKKVLDTLYDYQSVQSKGKKR